MMKEFPTLIQTDKRQLEPPLQDKENVIKSGVWLMRVDLTRPSPLDAKISKNWCLFGWDMYNGVFHLMPPGVDIPHLTHHRLHPLSAPHTLFFTSIYMQKINSSEEWVFNSTRLPVYQLSRPPSQRKIIQQKTPT